MSIPSESCGVVFLACRQMQILLYFTLTQVKDEEFTNFHFSKIWVTEYFIRATLFTPRCFVKSWILKYVIHKMLMYCTLYRNIKCLDCAKQWVDALQWSHTAAALTERKVLLCPILSTLKVKDMFFHLTGPVPRGLVSISLAHRLKWLIT